MKKFYRNRHFDFSEKISFKKRVEMTEKINHFLKNKKIYDVLDVGTINNQEEITANYIVKNLKNVKVFKSIAIQKINDGFFSEKINKSITSYFKKNEIKKMSADLVISTATIEHVGSYENQERMIRNIISLAKKYFIITTPNLYHPIEFHTKLPFIHWLPKKIHRSILSFFDFKFFSKEKNLNLMSRKNFKDIFKKINFKNYEIMDIRLFFFKSNILIFGKKKI